MREIKFRAWQLERKVMYWFDASWGNTYNQGARYVGMLPIEESLKHIGGFMGGDNRIMIDPIGCELMQYTGLKDKNGKEIYEGDIVKGNAKDNFVIVPMLGGLSLLNINYLGQHHNELITMPTNDVQTASWLNASAVIGNIYENPESMDKVSKVDVKDGE